MGGIIFIQLLPMAFKRILELKKKWTKKKKQTEFTIRDTIKK